MYFEHSKADDVKFILDLIEKIGKEIPEADMSNVNIAGKQNQGVYKNEVKLTESRQGNEQTRTFEPTNRVCTIRTSVEVMVLDSLVVKPKA